jgi:hypothetical protein
MRIQELHDDLDLFSTFRWRFLLFVFSIMDVFLVIAAAALGTITAVVAHCSAAVARWLAAANAIVAALIALLKCACPPFRSPTNHELTQI